MRQISNVRAAVAAVVVTSLSVTASAMQEQHVASKNGKSYSDSPVSVTVITADELQRSNFTRLSDFTSGGVNGLSVRSSLLSPHVFEASIRGLGSSGGDLVSGLSSVGVFVDGVYLGGNQSLSLDHIDLELIEVLKGPQGVLYGRNTAAGAINFVSKKPSDEFAVSTEFTIGRYDRFRSLTQLDTGNIGSVSAKFTYLTDEQNGWVRNEGEEDFNERDNEAYRVAVNLDVTENFVVDFSYDASDSKATNVFVQEGARLISNPISAVNFRQSLSSDAFNLTAVLGLGDNFSLTSISSYREVENESFGLDHEQLSQEFRLNGQLLEGGVSFVAGLNYYDDESSLRQNVVVPLGPMVDSIESLNSGDYEIESFSAFAQVTFALSDKLEVTAGWRETSDENELVRNSLDLNGNGTVFTDADASTFFDVGEADPGELMNRLISYDDDQTDYNITFAFTPNENLRTYFGFSTGSTAGGIALLSESLDPFVTETVETVEVGVSGAGGDSFKWSLVGFSSTVSSRQFNEVSPANTLIGDTFNAQSADDTELKGVEVGFGYLVAEGLNMTVDYQFLDDDVSPTLNSMGVEQIFYAVSAPRHSANVMIDYDLGTFGSADVGVELDYISQSRSNVSAFGNDGSSRDIFNARLNFENIQLEDDSGSVGIGIWAKNLNDDEYVESGRQLAGANPQRAFGEPRTYGVDLVWRFK